MLTNKVGLVTGGATGIGRAICEACCREGAKIALVDINPQAGQAAVDEIVAEGGEAIFVQADVSDEAAVEAMVGAVAQIWGHLDIACNSAAVSRGSGPIHEFSRGVFDDTLALCLTNTWLCQKYEIAAMRASGRGGSIVNISSNASLRGQAFNTAYATAKGGVNVLTQSSAAEYAGEGIRINAVSPGVVRTPGLEQYFQEQPKVAERLQRAAAMGRLGEPEEIAEAVVFLCSDRASFITGQILSVDGGASVKS
ncbi:MAG: SDR family NAD(P)-dependent oxidoreductase [Pseudomonadota bacterium]